MKEIVRTLLMEGVDEGTIHEVIDVIAEGVYKVTSRTDDGNVVTTVSGASNEKAAGKMVSDAYGGPDSAHKVYIKGNEYQAAQDIKNMFDNGKRKVHVTINNKKGNKSATSMSGRKEKQLYVNADTGRVVKR